MMIHRFLVTGWIVLSALGAEGNELDSFFDEANSFLNVYVNDGSVDYPAIKKNQDEIVKLYKLIGDMDLTSATASAKKAFYINAYNLAVIYWVAKHYPLKSPMDNSGFFDKVKHTIAGEQLTLNALEIKKLLMVDKDARVHFVLACAAKSCPPLASFAFVPSELEKQLTDRTKFSLNDPDWTIVNQTKKNVQLSKIFDWYNKDFTGGDGTVLEWINQYRREKIPASYSIGFYEYDWSLNEK